MTPLLVVLAVWVVLAGLAAGGFALVVVGARRGEEQALAAPGVPAQRVPVVDVARTPA